MKEKMKEMGEIKRAQERKNHETIQRLTSQLQQMQGQMNSMNDSGDFQDVDKRLPLDTWNQSGLQENVFENQFSTFDSPRGHPRRIQCDGNETEKQSLKQEG